jgi:hypothetical protein
MCRTCLGLLLLMVAAPGCIGVGPNDSSFATTNGFPKDWLVSSSLPESNAGAPTEEPQNGSDGRHARPPADGAGTDSPNQSPAEESLEDPDAKSASGR